MKSNTDEKYERLDELAENEDWPEELNRITDRLKEIDWFSEYREQLWRARDEGHRATVIILLNTFFEAYLYDAFKQYYREKGLTDDELFFIEKMNHNQILDQSRQTGILSENNYRILKNLNMARNSYAHDLLNWTPSNTTEIEEQGEVEAAFQLHQDILLNGSQVLSE
ncbi:hypothetical protein ACFQO4_02980 [Saliphagus sp. GCM10025334]